MSEKLYKGNDEDWDVVFAVIGEYLLLENIPIGIKEDLQKAYTSISEVNNKNPKMNNDLTNSIANVTNMYLDDEYDNDSGDPDDIYWSLAISSAEL